MSIFRGITANSMISGRSGDLVHLETTPGAADQQGIIIDLTSITDGAAIVISLADGRELAGWLIEHCVDGAGGTGVLDVLDYERCSERAADGVGLRCVLAAGHLDNGSQFPASQSHVTEDGFIW